MKNTKLYPESGIELTPFIAHHYDNLLKIATMGRYTRFLRKAIEAIGIQPGSAVLDLGCGTGRNSTLMVPYLGEQGSITGLDLSPIMEKQFRKRFEGDPGMHFHQQRIDIPFDLGRQFDVAFISFVIHGFPQEIREVILDNIFRHLRPGGTLAILDFAEFDMAAMPVIHRTVFKAVECPYAFDFVARDWKQILSEKGFMTQSETHFLMNYLRLLKVIRHPG